MMNVPLLQALGNIRDRLIKTTIFNVLKPLKQRLVSCAHSQAGLVIKAASSTLVKTGAIFHYQANRKFGRIAANVDMPALSGTVTNLKHNVFVFLVDKAGTVITSMGIEASTEADVKWPVLSQERAIIGYVKINPTGTGNFIGGTTALDDATVVPNAAYVSPIGPIDPSAVID